MASAGVLGIAIGFGAQTLVRDMFSKFFYLLDDAFRVGEYIQSGNYKGTVEHLGVRSVVLRHHRGPLYTIPYGQLGAVQNQSRDWVIDKLTIGLTYDSDLDKAKKLIKKIGKDLAADPEFAPSILEPLKMQGVEEFGDQAGPAVRHPAARLRHDQGGVRRQRHPLRVSDRAGGGRRDRCHGNGRRAPGAGARQGRGREVNALLLLAVATGVTGLEHDLPARSGDLDALLERREIRVLVPYSRTLFFNDKGEQRGLTADTLRDFEIFLNRKYPKKGYPITVVALPTTRDQLLSGLAQGRADIAAGNLTISAERAKSVDFSAPIASNIAEIVVTGPRSPKLAKLADLAGREIHVRRSSSYWASVERVKARPVAVPEALEDEDLMDMVGAGLIALTVVDEWKANIWAAMHKRVRPRPDLALTDGESIGWALRPGTPKLAAVVNEFIATHPGSREKRMKAYPRYLSRLQNATADEDWKRFEQTAVLFRKYAPRYKLDYLMTAALGYQESRLDQAARSSVGAVGIMQLLPDTGASMKVGDITLAEPNVHAGIKYLRQLHDRYITGEHLDDQNRTLLALASYNAGPGRIEKLRAEAPGLGFDPDIWFNNMELVVARRVGQEPVIYVRNIYKYYVAYKLQVETLEARRAASSAHVPRKKSQVVKPAPERVERRP
jgi:membrane-bound lytic murein transglycosylase MltF